MKVLFTGATSTLGNLVLKNLLSMDIVEECWCTIHQTPLLMEHPKLRFIPFNLDANEGSDHLPPSLDLLIHFAGLSRSSDEKRYWETNYHGTLKLVEQTRAKGCRKMFYISSLRAAADAGAYGESKLKTEEALRSQSWDGLTIVRPSEVYGGGGNEGIDRFLKMASQYRLAPMIIGNKKINFTPLFIEDFVEVTTQLICEMRPGLNVVNLFGPESLSGRELAGRMAKKYRALPIPIFWPALVFLLKISTLLGWQVMAPDQLKRITSSKAEKITTTLSNKKPLVRFLRD